MDRVAVFFDYQNVVGWAKGCFDTPENQNHIWPKATAELLAKRRQRPSDLVETLVYRGKPHPDRQPTAASANDRQTHIWEETGVTPHPPTHNLKSPHSTHTDIPMKVYRYVDMGSEQKHPPLQKPTSSDEPARYM